jgi:O-antigen/teichoic acid export membrane protein
VLARSVSLNILGQFGTLALGFAASVSLARALGPADRGLLALLVSVAEVGGILASVGLPAAVAFYASRRDSSAGGLLGNSLAYGAVLACVLVPAFWLLDDVLSTAFTHGLGTDLWVLAAAVIPLNFLTWTSFSLLTAELRFGLFNALFVASKALYLLLVLVLLAVFDLGVASGLVAMICALLVSAAGALESLLRRHRPVLDRVLFRIMVHYGARVQLWSASQLLLFRLDVLILQFFRPLSQVGYYVVAQIMAELAITLARGFYASVLPLSSRYEGDPRQADTTVASIRHHGILALAAIIGIAALGPVVISVAYGSAFEPAIVPMLIVLPGMWFVGTGTVVAAALSGRGRPGLASALSGLAVAMTVVLDLALIPAFGVNGAAVASLVSYTAYGVLSLGALSRVSGIPVTTLLIPSRADLALYPLTIRGALASLTRDSRSVP